MAKKYTAYLANLDVEVPVFSVDPKKQQMVIKVADIPAKLAKQARIDKQEFVTYWYDPGAGGNRLMASETEPNDYNAQQIVDAILEVSNAMKALASSRLTREALVILIHSRSKVAKRDIEYVLNNLESLEETWLKPKKK